MRTPKIVRLLALGALALGCGQESAEMQAAKPAAEIIAIAPGPPVVREMTGGEVHPYGFALRAGEYARVVVDQQGIDVVLVLSGPGDAELLTVDSPNGKDGPEEVSEVAAAPGEYRLEVRAAKADASSGRYELRFEEQRPAIAEDRRRVAAEKAFAQAAELRRNHRDADAVASYREALRLWQGLGDRTWKVAEAHYWIGHLQTLTAPREALSAFAEALALNRELGRAKDEARALNRSGSAHLWLGEVEAAFAAHREALEIFRRTGNAKGEAEALNDLGNAQKAVGEPREAMGSYRAALDLARRAGKTDLEAIALGNVGDLLSSLGRLAEAGDSYRQALAVMGDNPGRRAGLLNSLGSLHTRLGEPEQARACLEEALPLWREANDTRGTAICLNRLGIALAKLGGLEEALRRQSDALRLFREVGDRQGQAVILAEIAWLRIAMGEPEQALDLYRQAFPLAEETRDRSAQASIHHGKARALRDLGRLPEARASAEESLAAVEDLRTGTGGRTLQASYFSTRQGYYDLAIDVHMRLARQDREEDHAAAAFLASERRRARGLLGALAEAGAGLDASADPAFLGRHRALGQSLNALEDRREELFDGGAPAAEVEPIESEIRAILLDRDRLRAEIAAADPKYAALVEPRTLSLTEVQRELLDPETVLLSYSLGEERSFLWLVTPSASESFELPGRKEVEDLVRGGHELWSRSHGQAERSLERVAEALGRMLLGPVAGRLGDQRLLVVGDGALQYLPFAALPDPDSPSSPLIVRHEVVQLPSASVLATLRRLRRGRRPPEGELAVLADPVFGPDDPRVGPRLTRPAADRTRSLGAGRYDRLPHTRREAERILALAPAGRTFEAQGFAASRRTALNGKLGKYRILHIATHGLLHTEHPELSGLVLSQVDERGRPVEGHLRAHEIYDLDLAADLVVLSACETGLGREIRGEGVVGLPQAFLYAGAERVIVSLWNVGDESTAELMDELYRGMLAEGLRPAAALRAAQLAMLEDERWSSARFWAGFVLQGDWR